MKNPTARRFVPKRYGRGFAPVSRQGRLCIVILLVVIMGSAYVHNLLNEMGPSSQEYIGFLVDVFVVTLSSSRLFDRYTDGELKRRRGKRD